MTTGKSRQNLKKATRLLPILILSIKYRLLNVSSATIFEGVSKSLKFGEIIFEVTNSLDPDETPSNSASHPDPSCLHMAPRSQLAG